MQRDIRPNRRVVHVSYTTRHFLRARWMLLFSLLLTGCGGGESAPESTAASQQASSAPIPSATQDTSAGQGKSAPAAATNEAAVPSYASIAQLSALPHLSSLSDREKAGLLMLLASKSPSQRLQLINMYPSLVRLPDQQKEILLLQLEKIVPVTVIERQ